MVSLCFSSSCIDRVQIWSDEWQSSSSASTRSWKIIERVDAEGDDCPSRGVSGDAFVRSLLVGPYFSPSCERATSEARIDSSHSYRSAKRDDKQFSSTPVEFPTRDLSRVEVLVGRKKSDSAWSELHIPIRKSVIVNKPSGAIYIYRYIDRICRFQCRER